MRIGWALLGGAGLVGIWAACVPATADTDPHGGAGLLMKPSPATVGEPIVTSDGWTIHVDRLDIQIAIIAIPQDGKVGGFGGGYVFDATKEQDFVVRAIPAGPAVMTVSLTSRFIHRGGPGEFLSDPPAQHGIDPDVDERFLRVSDGDDPTGRGPGFEPDAGFDPVPPDLGPTVIVAAHADKPGRRSLRFDLSLDAAGDAPEVRFQIQTDALANVEMAVRAEALFTHDDGKVTFEEIARGDVDGDGVLTPDEARRIIVPACPKCTPADQADAAATAVANEDDLATRLEDRAANMFVRP